MRSLASKLTLAFLVVGIIGAVLAGVFISIRTQQAFDQFLFGPARPAAEAALSAHYRRHGSWDGVGQALAGTTDRLWRGERRSLATITDANGIVVFGGGQSERIGARVPLRVLRNSVPIRVEDQVVGYLIFDFFEDRRLPGAPERAFLAAINRSVVLASVGAAIAALILGAILARTLTRPIRELTAATQQIAGGELGIQVAVHTKDELGELASSFNSMSADLEQASRLRRQMTADIAHDLRTPLSVILGYTEALNDGKLQTTPEIANTLHQEAQHLNRLIDDLRTLSLADAGELPLHRSLASPALLLERAASSYRMQATQQDITIRTESAPGLPAIYVDSQRIAQVLGNLVSNALRHTPAGGTVTLSAHMQSGAVILCVHDTGSGISPEDLPHVFERFYRGDRARTNNGESGLGLTIAKSIVEAHGGSVRVASQPGEGTAFAVRLPVTLPEQNIGPDDLR
jgi:two-component system, OmpR family, sensor histidine kinase BaeS